MAVTNLLTPFQEPEPEEEEQVIYAPPKWDDVEADERFTAQSPVQKLQTLNKWSKTVNDYATATNQFEDEGVRARYSDFVKKKSNQFASEWSGAVDSGLYEDNLWGGAKRLLDRANLGVQQVAPNAIAGSNRLVELAIDAAGTTPALIDKVTGADNGPGKAFREATAPAREYFRNTADFYRNQANEISRAGSAIGGGVAGDLVQGAATSGLEATQDMALAMASGGGSMATPVANAMRSLNVSSVLSAFRSALPTLDEAEAQYMEEDPTITREQARMRALPEALVSGGSTALVTRLGGLTGVESILKESGAAGLRGRAFSVLKEAFAEGVEEAADQSLQDLAERFYRNPEKAWADTYKEIAMAWGLGAILGGGMSATAETFNAVADRAQGNYAPAVAEALREKPLREAAARTADLFGDETAAATAAEILDEIEASQTPDTPAGTTETSEPGSPATPEPVVSETPAPVEEPAPVAPIDGDAGLTSAAETEGDILADANIQRQPAPEGITSEQPTTEPITEGGETDGQETNAQEGQGRRETLLTPAEELPAETAPMEEGAVSAPADRPAPEPGVGLGPEKVGDVGGVGVISRKQLPARIVRDAEGVERTEPVFVNDPDTLAEMLHAVQGAQRIYIPDSVLDSEDDADQLDPDRIGYSFEKDTGRAYVTSATHSRYPNQPVREDGKLADSPDPRVQTLADLYASDPVRIQRSDAQTGGGEFTLPEEAPDYLARVEAGTPSELETSNPAKFAKDLETITQLSERIGQEVYQDNRGNSTPFDSATVDRISTVAQTLYLGRLRGAISGKATPFAVVDDAKKKFLDRLTRREGTSGSVDSLVEPPSVSDSPTQTQAAEDAGTGSGQELGTLEADNGEAASVQDIMTQALDRAAAELSPEENAVWQQAKRRLTEKDAKGRWNPLTQEMKAVAAKVQARSAEIFDQVVKTDTEIDLPMGSLETQGGPQADMAVEQIKQQNLDALRALVPGDPVVWSVEDLLDGIAKDKAQAPFVRLMARTLLKQRSSFEGVDLRVVSSPKANWSGTYAPLSEEGEAGILRVNLAVPHEGSIGQTFVHELWHHVTLNKVRAKFPRNAVEEAAYQDLKKILAYVRANVVVPEAGQSLTEAARQVARQERTFYGLTDVPELVSEALSNPSFAAWLATRPALPGLKTKGSLMGNLWNAIKQILKNTVIGAPVRADSLLSQAMDRMFILSQRPVTDAEVQATYGTSPATEAESPAAQQRAAYNPRNPAAPQSEALFRAATKSPHITYEAASLGGPPARTTLTADGQLVVEFDPDTIAEETDGMTVEATQEYIQALVRHEEIHAAGFMSDYRTADEQGRLGAAKMEAFHDEVMTPRMREETADAYLTQLEGESNADYAARRADFLANKEQVAAEFKRRFAERYLTGYAQEDVLDRLETETGNKFQELLRQIADYLAGRFRYLAARYQAFKDPRIAIELELDLRNLRLLMDRSGRKFEQLQREDDMRRQAAWLNEQAKKAGFDSYDTAPFDTQMSLAEEWRANNALTLADTVRPRGAAITKEEATSAGDALLKLAGERGEDLFSLNTELSNSKDLREVLNSTGTEFAVMRAGESVWISTINSAQIGDPVMISIPGNAYVAGDLVDRTSTTSTIRRYDNGQEGTRPSNEVVDANRSILTYETRPGEWVIDSSQGTLDESTQAYQGIYSWAANTGVKIVPDETTSWAGNYRRNAHQLSSALREQSAEHFTPTDDQLGRMFPGVGNPLNEWTRASTGQKVEALMRAEISYVEQAVPGIVQFDYELGDNTIGAAGERLDIKQFGQRLREEISRSQTGKDLPEPDRVGVRTAVRYLAAKALLRKDSRRSVAGDSDLGPLKGSFYASWRKKRRAKANNGGWKRSGILSQGDMDMRVYNQVAAKDAALRAAEFRVSETVRRFDNAVKTAKLDPELVRTALGTTDNRLTDDQNAEYKKLKRTDDLATAEAFRITALKENTDRARAEQAAALAALPKPVADAVRDMRQGIDNLSKQLIAEGMISKDMQVTIEDNMDVYLNRSYEVFDNPDWQSYVLDDLSPDAVRIRNRAASLLRSQLEAEKAASIRRDARAAGTAVPTPAESLSLAKGLITDDDVLNLMHDYLAVADKDALLFVGRTTVGKKNTSILKLRGQIPQEIRDLWGEYKDPKVNYARTMLKLSGFAANHAFQKNVLEAGIAGNFIWKEGVSTGPKPVGWKPIFPESAGQRHPTPLAGAYAPEIVGEAFADLSKPFDPGPVLQGIMAITGLSMGMKTAYSVQTHVRNFLGNGLIMVNNGYLYQDPKFVSRFLNSLKTVGPTQVGVRPVRDKAVTEYIDKMIRLGIMGDGVKAQTVKALSSVVWDRNPSNAWNDTFRKAFAAAQDANSRIIDAYQAGDDFWKILAFESERAVMQKAYPSATAESLDQMAADRVVNVIPTYSRIPKVVRDLVKKQPFLAPFISWTSEIIRTTGNSVGYAVSDIRSGNETLRDHGIRRLGSMAVTAGLLGAVAKVVASATIGEWDDEDNWMRRFLPEWQKFATLMPVSAKDGVINFWDLSYLNPYNTITEPFLAFGEGMQESNNPLIGAKNFAGSLLEPWTGEQLFFGALIDIARNTQANGAPLTNQADSEFNKTAKKVQHVWDALKPGTVATAERIALAAQGKVRQGRAYELSNEILSPLIGQRLSTVDTLNSFQLFKAAAFQRAEQSARQLATKEYRSTSSPDLNKIRDNYIQANTYRMQQFQEMRKDIEALRGLGVPEAKLMTALRATGIPKGTLDQILSGRYVRLTPSEEVLETGRQRVQGEERFRALMEVVRNYPEVQNL